MHSNTDEQPDKLSPAFQELRESQLRLVPSFQSMKNKAIHSNNSDTNFLTKENELLRWLPLLSVASAAAILVCLFSIFRTDSWSNASLSNSLPVLLQPASAEENLPLNYEAAFVTYDHFVSDSLIQPSISHRLF